MAALAYKDKATIRCPLCDSGTADVTARPGGGFWLGCWSCAAEGVGRGEWLREVAREVGAPGGGALLDEPWRWLAGYTTSAAPRRGRVAPLPDLSMIDGWHAALLSDEDALRYLRRKRGLKDRVIRGNQIGYAVRGAPGPYRNAAAFTLPVFNATGELVNVRKRFWPDLPSDRGRAMRYVGLGGRGTHLYPGLPDFRLAFADLDAILVAGEFDALVGRAHRLPTVTATSGAMLPDALADEFAEWSVAVLFDHGERKAATRAVRLLRDAGADAWRVPPGMPRRGDDLTDFFVSYRRTRGDLLRRVLRSR